MPHKSIKLHLENCRLGKWSKASKSFSTSLNYTPEALCIIHKLHLPFSFPIPASHRDFAGLPFLLLKHLMGKQSCGRGRFGYTLFIIISCSCSIHLYNWKIANLWLPISIYLHVTRTVRLFVFLMQRAFALRFFLGVSQKVCQCHGDDTDEPFSFVADITNDMALILRYIDDLHRYLDDHAGECNNFFGKWKWADALFVLQIQGRRTSR